MRYEDFVIQVDPDKEGYTARVVRSPAGEGQTTFSLPSLDDCRRDAEAFQVARSEGGQRDATPDPTGLSGDTVHRDARRLHAGSAGPAPEELGSRLFQTIFSGQILALYDQSLGSLKDDDCGLRVKLKLQSSDPRIAPLTALPWELLHRRDTGDFLSLSRLTPVTRYLDVPRPISPARLPEVLRVVVALASPQDHASLNLAHELKLIEEVSKARGKGRIQLVTLKNATLGGLREILSDEPSHVVHFMGHGSLDERDGGMLFFEKPDGTSEAVSARDLATKLKDFRSLRLVFLNACNTAQTTDDSPFASVASALVQGGIPAVVAMQRPISDAAAIAFSQAFYRSLAAGEPVDTSTTEGRQAIHAADMRSVEWATPVLFMRVPDGRLFEIPSPPRWRRPVAAAILAAVVGSSAFLHPDVRGLFANRPPVFEISQSFASDVDGLTGVVTEVEILEHGRMRVHFEFRNASDQPQKVGFDYRESYLADEFGNAYEVLKVNGDETPTYAVVEQIEGGGARRQSLEVDAPRDGARKLQVKLASPEKVSSFPLFEVDLPPYPEELSIKTMPKAPPPGAEPIDVGKSLETPIEGLQATLSRIELLESQMMRWNLELLNRSTEDQQVDVDYERSYIVDELGQRYPVVSYDTMNQPYQGWKVRRALRRDHWVEFQGPRGGAKKFTIMVFVKGEPQAFTTVEVELPDYDSKYAYPVTPPPPPPPAEPIREEPVQEAEPETVREAEPETVAPPPPPPQPTSVHYEGEVPMTTSLEGVQGRLARIERLDNGRMRWHFEVWNDSATPVEVGFDAASTYLADNEGTRYKPLAEDPAACKARSLAGGERLSCWFEFSRPVKKPESFLAVVGSHDPSVLRFRPVLKEWEE